MSDLGENRKLVRRDPGFVGERAETPAAVSGATVNDAVKSGSLGLGDLVEIFAKPIGCLLDRVTNAAPIWLIKPRITRKIQLLPPAWVRQTMRYRLTHLRWRLPATWRTNFCGPTAGCACQRRKAKLNALLPDLRSATAWKVACKTLATALASRLQALFRRAGKTP